MLALAEQLLWREYEYSWLSDWTVWGVRMLVRISTHYSIRFRAHNQPNNFITIIVHIAAVNVTIAGALAVTVGECDTVAIASIGKLKTAVSFVATIFFDLIQDTLKILHSATVHKHGKYSFAFGRVLAEFELRTRKRARDAFANWDITFRLILLIVHIYSSVPHIQFMRYIYSFCGSEITRIFHGTGLLFLSILICVFPHGHHDLYKF